MGIGNVDAVFNRFNFVLNFINWEVYMKDWTDAFDVRITQSNTRYVVETSAGRLHVLNRKALIWNLKNVFKVTPEQGKAIMRNLDEVGLAVLTKEAS